MKSAYLIVLAVGLINVAASRSFNEKYLNRELRMCGPELIAACRRICGNHGYDPETKYTPDEIESINKMCCAKKCKVVDVIKTFCKNARYLDDGVQPKSVEVLPPTTQKTTTKVPMTLSVAEMPTTTEKLANVWFITG